MSGTAAAGLAPAELTTLRRLADSASTPPAVARRARAVLAADGRPDPLATRWARRFAEHGPAGLQDRPRSGRPVAERDAAALPVLLAPLVAPSAGWTSRSIADSLGVSQSRVARTWAHSYDVPPSPAAAGLPDAGLRLVAVAVDPGGSLLVLAADGARDLPAAGPVMHSPRRRPLQTLLAADLLAAGRAPVHRSPGRPAARERAGQADLALVRAARRAAGPATTLHVLTRRPLGCAAGGPDEAVVVEVVVDAGAGWQGLLGDLVRRCTRSSAADLAAAQQAAMEWARSDRPRLEWTAFDRTPRTGRPLAYTSTDRPVDAVPAPAPRSAGQALADAVLAVLLERLTAGRLAGGDRVTESFLARTVHASRSQVRDALRSLAAAGLVDLEPHRGAVIPTPQTADVVETYAARRALGAVVVRRAARLPAGGLDPAERALDDLLACARGGNAHATGEADLRFQDALAGSTGMRRVPRMFADLTAQLRLFIAVMGLDYTYSVPDMCRDDTALMEHLRARDETAAAQAWHRKIDEATAYMTAQLARSGGVRRRRA